MRCPKCKSDNVTVLESRPKDDTTRRRRMCISCGERYTTVEVLMDEMKDMKNVRACLAYLAGLAGRKADHDRTDDTVV